MLTSLGELTWDILKDHLERIYRVTDDEVIDSMKIILEEMKIIIEPSCATAVAITTVIERAEKEGVNQLIHILEIRHRNLFKLEYQLLMD